jgi:hypothetical protein
METRAMNTSIGLVLLVVAATVGSAFMFIPACNEWEKTCVVAAPAGVSPFYCDTAGVTQRETLCPDPTVPTAGVGVGFCRIWKTPVGVRYPGPCGCPNECSGHGKCAGGVTAGCLCDRGWTSPDCSLPSCNGAACSGRGHCGALHGQEACLCAAEYTGVACETRVATNVPDITPTLDVKHFSPKDKYKLVHHPVFNMSTLASIRLTLADEDLAWFLDPAHLHDEEYRPAEFWFDNGVVTERLENVGVKHSGSLMLLYPKKNVRLGFAALQKGRRWYDLKALVLKSASMDPTYDREIVAAAVGYSLGMPVPRMSLANLWVNGINFGLYVAYEPYDELFLETRAELGD